MQVGASFATARLEHLSDPQQALLQALGKRSHWRDRKGWTDGHGRESFAVGTGRALVDRGLARVLPHGQRIEITERGREVLAAAAAHA